MSGYAAYGYTQNVTETSRDVEYRLLAQVTSALSKARENASDAPKLIDALMWNKQVWDAFICDLSSEANRLPKELRARLIGIGLWVNRETTAAIDGGGDLDALIGVNRTIMQGLR
ncbi:MAG: flagellar biosynthesis regulator FlaF [Rhodospirillales bacterium]|nr:flagellar biosynthesis regulator FlaF [Rhodospirillales bacterium]